MSSTRRKPARKTAAKRPSPPRPRKPAARRPHGGSVVNPRIPLPRPPGPWVDEKRNYVTGERYSDFRAHVTPEEAGARLRQEARRQGLGDPYISRGPILWVMRVMKLEAWYEKALYDGALWDPKRRRPLELTAKRHRRRVKRKAKPYTVDPRYGF